MRSASEFYALRDQRTDSCLDQDRDYASRVVKLSIDHSAAATVAGQFTFLLSANLLARWCRHLELDIPHVRVASSLARLNTCDDLFSVTAAIARAADTFIALTRRASTPSICLHVGAAGPANAFRISSDGWLSMTGGAVANTPGVMG